MKKDNRTAEDRLAAALVPAEEQPYQVPENWVWAHLGSITVISMGQSPEGSATTDNPADMPLIGGAADMGSLYPSPSRYTKSPTKICKADDIILCIRATLGRPIYSDGQYCLGRGVAGIRPVIGTKELYRYGFQNFEQYLYDHATGSTFAQVTGSVLQNMPFPVIPMAEQHRIVDRITSLFAALDEAKEEAEAIIDGYEERKAAILHRAFTGELTEDWRKERGIDINTWQSIRFESIIISGPQNGLYKSKDSYGQGYRILRVDGFYDGWIEPWKTLKRLSLTQEELDLYSLHIGDIVVNRVNSMPYLGKSALVRDLPEPCVFESNMMRIVIDKEMAVPEYVIRYLNSSIGLLELRKKAKQAINQASINQTDVKNVQISLPTLAEQHEIVCRLDSLLSQEAATKEAAEETITQIATLRQSILARAFRGELGTNDPTDEPAIELLKRTLL